jgi:hypothetical protein
MRGSIPVFPQCAFVAWCSDKKAQGQFYLFTLPQPLQVNARLVPLIGHIRLLEWFVLSSAIRRRVL